MPPRSLERGSEKALLNNIKSATLMEMAISEGIESPKRAHYEAKDYFTLFVFFALEANILLTVLFCLHILPARVSHFERGEELVTIRYTTEFALWSIIAFISTLSIYLYAWKYPPLNSWFAIGSLLAIITIIIWGMFLLNPLFLLHPFG